MKAGDLDAITQKGFLLLWELALNFWSVEGPDWGAAGELPRWYGRGWMSHAAVEWEVRG
jgi:hypothetical protein